ncbi:MAG: cytochrome c biogenesis protein ResB [Syntrophomonadaceae bacterium]
MLDKQKKANKDLIAWLSSMKFAIYLLILVGAVTALGTIIPQGEAPAFYLHTYGDGVGAVINLLTLGHLYQAWWFYLLMLVLTLAILVCAFQRLRRARSITTAGSLVFHLAIVVILAGAGWSLGYARSALVDVAEQQAVNLADYGFGAGQLTLNSFAIEYYPDFQPRQYTSDISLTGYEQQDYNLKINVNNPLQAGNLKVYQSNWGWMLKIKATTNGSTQVMDIKDYDTFPLGPGPDNAVRVIFLPDYAEDQHGAFSRTTLPNNPCLGLSLLQSGRTVDMALIAPGEEVRMGQYRFSFEDYAYYSGLQIKYDPGVNLVFAGFILLLLGLLGRYWRLFFAREGD